MKLDRCIRHKSFNRKCVKSLIDCKITRAEGVVVTELKKEILKKATIYKKEIKIKKKIKLSIIKK